MKRRPAPAAATWFLKLFCSNDERESVTGDLLEQYQLGRGRFWYWRQVLSIAFLGLCGKVVRRPLVRSEMSLIGRGFSVCIVVAVLIAVALTDIWPILLVGVMGGVFAGLLKFAHDKQQDQDSDRARTVRNFPSGNPAEPVRLRVNNEPAFANRETRHSEEKPITMHVHRGINSASVAAEGFEGLPGLIMVIAFVFIFLGIFWPRNNDWLGALFFIAEIGAAALYLLLGRRNRRDSEYFQKTLHQINEPRDRTNGSATHIK